MKRIFGNTVKVFLTAAAVLIAAALLINFYIVRKTKSGILKAEDLKTDNADCILILGAGVRNGKPTPMLRDRLLTGIELYEKGAATTAVPIMTK